MITLTQKQEQLVSEAVETGAYQSSAEVIDRALEVLRSQDDWLRENKDLINAKIERAIGQIERGEGISPEQLRSRLDNCKRDFEQKRG